VQFSILRKKKSADRLCRKFSNRVSGFKYIKMNNYSEITNYRMYKMMLI